MFNLISKPRAGRAALSAALAIAVTLPLTAFASGGGGGGFSSSGTNSAPREVDKTYEFGKSLYLGRAPGSQKVKYCVKVDGEAKKLRGRALRPFRGASQLDLANALYNCDKPEQRALLSLKKEEVAYVLYYLNKRYKLDLSSAG